MTGTQIFWNIVFFFILFLVLFCYGIIGNEHEEDRKKDRELYEKRKKERQNYPNPNCGPTQREMWEDELEQTRRDKRDVKYFIYIFCYSFIVAVLCTIVIFYLDKWGIVPY